MGKLALLRVRIAFKTPDLNFKLLIIAEEQRFFFLFLFFLILELEIESFSSIPSDNIKHFVVSTMQAEFPTVPSQPQ